MTGMFYSVFNEKLQAIEMAEKFLSFIPKEKLKEGHVRKLDLQLKQWLMEYEAANIDNEWQSAVDTSETS